MKKVDYSAHATIPQTHAFSVYFCGKEQCESGQSFGPVLRTQYLFHYVVSGKGILRTKNTTYHIAAGQAFMILPDQVVYLEADKDEPWEYLWVAFDGVDAMKVAENMGFTEKNPVYRGEPDSRLEELLNKLLYHFKSNQNDKYNILAMFFAAAAIVQKNSEPRKLGEQGYMEKALDYLHHNYTYRIRIEDIARYVGLDRTYLFKLFVKNLGVAPQEYLIRYRLEHAAQLLKGSNLSTEQIAYSCGFRDAPSFCKHFKARFKISPLAYRKQKDA